MNFLKNATVYFRERNIYTKIFLLFLAFLLLTQAVGFVSYRLNAQRLRDFDPWQPAYSNSGVPFFARWDSGWYVSIVKNDYVLYQDRNSNVAFFPLYPLLIKGFSKILPINYFYLAQVISWMALFGALVFFYKLLRFDHSEERSWRVLLYMLVFPWAFFLAAAYTESLFLLLVTASFYYARKQNWPVSSIFGFFAALTRVGGILLFPALLLEFFMQNRKITARLFWLALIPLGLASFMTYLKLRTGDFLAFLHNISTYTRKPMFPLYTVWLEIRHTFGYLKGGEILKMSVSALGLLALGLCVYLLIKKARQIRLSYLAFAFLSVLLPLSSGTMISIGRYLLVIFPIFIAASLVENKTFRNAWFLFGLIFLVISAFSFVGWYFIV